MVAIAPKGAKAVFKKYGREHYVRMAKIRWAKKKSKKNE